MNLFEVIDEAMQSDILEGNSGSDYKSDRLREHYEKADTATKLVIDDIFITLTGWSLQTLIGKCGEPHHAPPEDIDLVDALDHVFGAENVLVFGDEEDHQKR